MFSAAPRQGQSKKALRADWTATGLAGRVGPLVQAAKCSFDVFELGLGAIEQSKLIPAPRCLIHRPMVPKGAG